MIHPHPDGVPLLVLWTIFIILALLLLLFIFIFSRRRA
jgi:hypothetical protein